jgi:acetyl-CoA synthetase
VLERFEITHAFLPPSALRMIRQADVGDREREFDTLRLLTSGGESLDPETRLWAESFFDVTVHEGYGSTEMFNHIVGDCTALEPATPGWMGYALPGHRIRLLDPETRAPVDVGETGEIALSRDDPTLFEEYLGRPEATADAYHDEWYLTGDLARRNEAGQFQHVGRADDLIISSGYRIGPSEIENVLTGHAAVTEAGVVGVPDDERGEVPKAFVVLDPEHDPSDRLRSELREHVRDRLASYEYPREIAFVAALPRTTTGKLKRGDLTDLRPVGND